MDAAVVYESMFGNTREVAEAIATGIREADPSARAEGFIVTGGEGPLRDGELERARTWGAALARPVALPGRA